MREDDVRVVPDWELCDRLRRSMRMVPGLSNEDIAEMMGVQRTTVSTWLGGRRVPNRAILLVWADMTGVDEQWLLTGTPSEGGAKYAIRDSNPEPAD